MVVGRDRELTALADSVRAGRPVVLHGEGGIGKTALLGGMVAAAGRRAHTGGGLAALSWMAYAPVARAMGADPPPGDAARVAGWVAGRVGDDVLVLDDLQWADHATLALLAPLARAGTLVVGAVRRGDPGTAAALAAARGAGAEVMEIGELERGAAVDLLRRERPGLAEDEVERLVAQVGGHPLMLLELSRTVGSPALRLSLEARLARLSPAARRAAALIAVLGRPAPEALAGSAAAELVEAGLAVAESGGVALRHALLADAIAEGLDSEERRELHAELAGRLPDRGEAARHLAGAGRLEAAHAMALEAGAVARRPGERARHLLLAADCAGRQWWADELRLRAAEALVVAGEYAEALRQTGAVEGREPEVRGRVHLWRARAHWRRGEVAAAREEVDEGLAAVAGTGTLTEARLAIEEAHLLAGAASEPGPRFAAALERTRELGEDAGIARWVAGVARCNAGDPAAAVDLRAALQAAREQDDTDLECEAGDWLSRALRLEGATVEAGEVCAALEARCAELGLRGRELEFALGRLSARLAVDGPSPEILDGLRHVLAGASEPALAERVRARLGVALADAGSAEEAGELLEAGDAPVLRAARAEVAWLTGRPARAVAAVAAVADPVGPVAAVLAWAGAETDAPAPAPPGPRPMARAAVAVWDELHGVALLAGPARAEPRFAAAASAWTGVELRGRLRCEWAAGDAARRAGRAAEARERLEAAERLAEETGHALLLGRIRRSLRATGARRSAAAGPRAPEHGVLSGREHEVLVLVGAGLTSPEIAVRLGIARSTVETLVRSAMRKLGARSRRQAAAALAPEAT